ncbi:MAG TPA: aldo/keto reductase [Dehalococcoidales bacterium]|nr:aldo/keto reductase [Dehalococcoidales bacterium]
MEHVKLNNNVEIPILGLGTFQLNNPEICERSVFEAIKIGYRLIDTAQAYNNEESVGNAIVRCGVPRDQLFITTKVWFRSYEHADAERSILESLRKLKVDYIDLVLLHWPFGNYYAAYRVLESFYAAKKIRAIGVSNFNPDRLIDLIKFNKVVPAVNQVETNLLYQQEDSNRWMKKYNVRHQAYAPLGQGKKNQMYENPALVKIAKKYGKSPQQIALKFQLQRGIIVIPKSQHVERIRENFSLFDFVLTEAEMKTLRGMDEKVPLTGAPENPELVETAMTW